MGQSAPSAIAGIWRSDLVVRFLPLSFYAKKKSAEKKARLRRLQWIWRSDLVVRFLPLSSYAKKQAAERKARRRRLQGYGEVI